MRIAQVVHIFVICALFASVASEVELEKQETHTSGFCGEEEENSNNLIQMATLGGLQDSHSESSQNSVEIDALAQFAVQEHNKKENALLELSRVVKAQEQVVSGIMHHLTLEVVDAGKKKLYEAKIWVKPWLHFKELHEFKHVEDVPSFTSSDLGAKEGPSSGWKSVPVHDPVVQDAAKHAVKTIQQRSNSLFPYELREIVHVNAEVTNDDCAKFDMLLKVKRGEKEEKFKVKLHKNNQGVFQLNDMEQDHS